MAAHACLILTLMLSAIAATHSLEPTTAPAESDAELITSKERATEQPPALVKPSSTSTVPPDLFLTATHELAIYHALAITARPFS